MAKRTVQVDVDLVRPFLEKRLAELEAETAKLRKALGGKARTAVRAVKRRKRQGMSAAQKAEVSKRMKKYWAERRKAK